MSESGSNSQQSAESSLSKELYEICNSDSLSKEGLHEIIERHNNRQVGDNKFFLKACYNKQVNEGIIRCLLEYFPAAASATIENGWSPLHYACCNKHVTLNIIQLLVDAAPDFIRRVNIHGRMPLHYLCKTKALDEAAALEILELLIEKHPEAVRHADNGGYLPIHHGGSARSPDFCSNLIELYPGSERMTNVNGNHLPLHYACLNNTLATVEYLYKRYPDAINHATDGGYPIHAAIIGVKQSLNPIAAVDIVKFLLCCDPNVKLQKGGRTSLLHFTCRLDYNDSNIQAAIEMIKVIYDAHPEVIENYLNMSNIHSFLMIRRCHQQVQAFINNELVYARQAKDYLLMITPDDYGQLPLHTAIQNNATLGSIKLLVKGHPPAVQSPDNSGALPLLLACQHHDSASVVQYLVGLDTTSLEAVDGEGNTALHVACHRARHEIIAMLLERYDAVSVSKRNTLKKLPIDLLWESNEVINRDSIEYTESVFRLLTAYPETLMNVDM
eukprot:scaffold13390_cov96-Skeletonema_marinoi.AAC.1